MRENQLDEFYSAESPDLWKQIIGEELHYHYALFSESENSLQDGLRHAVRSLYGEIPRKASVLDAGCGWGGPARMLERELGCKLQGITISRTQFDYCRSIDLDVMLGDLESIDLSGRRYDSVLMLESLDHIKCKEEVLFMLRQLAPKLILRVNCVKELLNISNSKPGQWQMYVETPQMIQRRLERAGWNVVHKVNRRPDSLPSFGFWLSQLNAVFPKSAPPGQLGLLKQLCEFAMSDLDGWADANPLMEFVAV